MTPVNYGPGANPATGPVSGVVGLTPTEIRRTKKTWIWFATCDIHGEIAASPNRKYVVGFCKNHVSKNAEEHACWTQIKLRRGFSGPRT